jgi:hypothetical protein
MAFARHAFPPSLMPLQLPIAEYLPPRGSRHRCPRQRPTAVHVLRFQPHVAVSSEVVYLHPNEAGPVVLPLVRPCLRSVSPSMLPCSLIASISRAHLSSSSSLGFQARALGDANARRPARVGGSSRVCAPMDTAPRRVRPGNATLLPRSIAARAGSRQKARQHTRGAADARPHPDGAGLAVPGTGSALHARSSIGEHGAAIPHGEDGVRADLDAHAAAGAPVSVQLKRHGALDVSHPAPPRPTNRPTTQSPRPMPAAATCAATAKRISRSTPLSDV